MVPHRVQLPPQARRVLPHLHRSASRTPYPGRSAATSPRTCASEPNALSALS